MTRVVKYLPEQIERCRRRMQAAPAKDTGKSKAETAGILAKDVRAMQKKGYTLKEVTELFREEGLVISVSLLERVLENEAEEAPQVPPETPKTESTVEQKREPRPQHQANKQATPKTEQVPEAPTVPLKKQKDSIPQAASSYPAVTPDYDLSEL